MSKNSKGAVMLYRVAWLVYIGFIVLFSYASGAATAVMPALHDDVNSFNEESVRWRGLKEATKRSVAIAGTAASTMPRFDEARLLRTAEDEGYGYKFANLAELNILTEWFNEYAHAPLPVRVPEFFGISSGRVVAGLREQDFDAAAQWAPVVGIVSPTARADVMKAKLLPNEFWLEQQKFGEAIGSAFDRMVQMHENAPLDVIAHREGADALIADVNAVHDVFMVRSTGKEDTRTMANAGGNESIANVAPEKAALWHAAKDVVLSYFGEKSLKQRLGLGDPSLFSTDVFCPVLVQRMIGERSEDSIPVCGVMFTEEPEGGVSWREEKDDTGVIKTTGITTIQAAYGHNEGVVNSKVAVDTVIAQLLPGMTDPVFYPVVRAKRERLVPVAGRPELAMKENPKKLILAAALSNEMLITLKKFADALERYYGYPVDVEFVVRDGVVYIVQARPIVHKAGRANPSYLARLSDYSKDSIFKGRTIGAAGGGVVSLRSKTEAIMMPTIGGALEIYLKSPLRDSVKAIIVGADAPATSHEATTFRSEGKPVVFVRNFHQLVNAFRPDKKLVVSPLQHCGVVIPIAQDPEIREGWCAYPLPAEISVTDALFLAEGNIPASLVGDVPAKGDPVAWSVLIERIKTGSAVEVVAAAAQLQGQLDGAIKKIGARLEKDAALAKQIFNLQKALSIVCQCVVTLTAIGQDHPLYVTRLLPIVYLDALVAQWPSLDEVLDPWSIAMLIKTLQREGKKAKINPAKFGTLESKQFFTQLKQLEDKTFDDHSKTMWAVLTNAVARTHSPLIAPALAALIAQLQEFDLLPIWLHTTMGRDIQHVLESKALDGVALPHLIDGWVQPLREAKEFLSQVKQLRMRSAGFQLNGFDDPKKFVSTWKQFNETLLQPVSGPVFKKTFLDSNATARLAACFMLNELIDLFDRAIKVVKGSGHYKPEEKVARFKEMLVGYDALLRQLLVCVPDGAIVYYTSRQSDYLGAIDHVLRRDFSATDLEATAGFNVSAFTVGSGVELKTVKPQPTSGEDAFTTIHQNLLVCTSVLIACNGGRDIQRPALLVQAEKMLLNAGQRGKAGQGGRAQAPALVGCSITTSGVRLHYNLPLNNHSCQFFLDYVNKTKEVLLTVQFYGHAEERWFRIANFAVLVDFAKVCSVQNYVITASGASFTFVLTNDVNVGMVGDIIEGMIKHTFDQPLIADPLVARLTKTWQEAYIAVESTLGVEYLLHCQWLLEWDAPADHIFFAEKIIPMLEAALFLRNGKAVPRGLDLAGMLSRSESAKKLLLKGIIAVLEQPQHRSFDKIAKFMPLYLSKNWYSPEGLESLRAIFDRHDAAIRDRGTLNWISKRLSMHAGVRKFLSRIKELRGAVAPDKIFYLVTVSDSALGSVRSYQTVPLRDDAQWSVGLSVNALPESEVVQVSLKVGSRGVCLEHFFVACLMHKVLHPETIVLLRDYLHDIKFVADASNKKQCDDVMLLLEMVTVDSAVVDGASAKLAAMHTKLSQEQKKQFFASCLQHNVVTNYKDLIFKSPAWAWLRDAAAVGVHDDFAALPEIVAAAQEVLCSLEENTDMVYANVDTVMQLIGNACDQEAHRNTANSTCGKLVDALIKKKRFVALARCVEQMIPLAEKVASSVEIAGHIIAQMRGYLCHLGAARGGQLALLQALVKFGVATDNLELFEEVLTCFAALGNAKAKDKMVCLKLVKKTIDAASDQYQLRVNGEVFAEKVYQMMQ